MPPFVRPLLPAHEQRRIGSGGLILPANLQLNVDYLVVPPPPPGVLRWVDAEEHAGAVVTTGAAAYFNPRLKRNGVFYQLPSISTVAAGGAPILLPAPLLLTSEDEGLYIRLTAGDPTGISAYGRWVDVQGVERQITPLVKGEKVSLLPEAKNNEALKIACDPNGSSVFFGAYFMNGDSVPHVIELFASDGVNETILPVNGVVPALFFTIAAGEMFPALYPGLTWGVFAQGWSLRARLTTTVVNKDPEILAAFVRTNASPVKPSQGGAF